MKKSGGDDAQAKDFVARLYKNVPVLDSGARGSTTTFVERGIGDVLITWESEAQLATTIFGADKFDIVVPSLSILAEPPVALVDTTVDKRHTREIAQAYLEFLYTDAAQEIAATHFYRPRNPAVAARYRHQFPALDFLTIEADFGGWRQAQSRHFNDGGTFDQIYQPGL